MNYWKDELRSRLGDRKDLGWEGVRERYWADLPAGPVAEFFELFEQEVPLPAGMLRPKDSLKPFTEPINSWNPFKVMSGEMARADGVGELDYQLAGRTKEQGLDLQGATLETVDDLIRCWCGQLPDHLR